MHNTGVITSHRQTALVIVGSGIFLLQNWQLYLNLRMCFYVVLFPSPPEAFSCPFFGFSLHQSVTPSHPVSQPGSQPSCLPASSLLSDRQAVEEPAGFWNLMVHALLPGLKMDWNVVYLRHSVLPQSPEKIKNTEATVWDSGSLSETCWEKNTISPEPRQKNDLFDSSPIFHNQNKSKPSMTAMEEV